MIGSLKDSPMKIICLVLFAFIAATQSVFSQDSEKKFSIAELEGMAKQWFAGYRTGLQAELVRRQQLMVAPDDPKDLTVQNFSKNLVVDSSNVQVLGYLNDGEWKDRFVIFHLSESSSLHWSAYVVAMNFNGTIYRLAGFGETDLTELIYNEFVDSNDADLLADIAIFVARNVNTDAAGSVVVIDSENIDTHIKDYPGLYAPVVDTIKNVNLIIGGSYVGDIYRVRMFTVRSNGELRLHNIEIANNTIIDHKWVLVKS